MQEQILNEQMGEGRSEMRKKLVWCIMLLTALTALSACRNSRIQSSGTAADNKEVADAGENSYFSESAYREKFCKNRTNLKKYQEQYQEDISQVQKKDFRKLSFDQCVFAELPDSDSVSVLDVGERGISVEESISVIKDWLADIGQEDMDLDTELRDVSGQFESDESQETPYSYPSVMEHKEELVSGNHFLINTNSCHVQMGSDGFYSMSDGTIISYLGEDGHAIADAFRADEEEIVAEGTFDEMAAQSYELLSGKVSVGEAADVVKRYFEAGTPFPVTTDVGIDIPYVSVFSLGDKYGYAFQLRRTYRNIPFAYTLGGGRIGQGEQTAREDDKTAYVVNDRTVSAYIGYNEAQPFTVLIEESDVLSLKDAMDLLDSKLAGEMQVQVGNVGLVYCKVCLDIIDMVEEIEVVYPCWALDGISQNNGRRMRIYMDVLTGDLYMYAYHQEEDIDE